MGVYEIHKYISEETDASEIVSRIIVYKHNTAQETLGQFAKENNVKSKDLIIIDITDSFDDCPTCLGEGNQNRIWAPNTPEYAANLACNSCCGSGVHWQEVKPFNLIKTRRNQDET